MLLHIRDLIELRMKTTILVRTIVSGVVVLLTDFFLQFCQHYGDFVLSVAFVTGGPGMVYLIYSIYSHFAESESLDVKT